MTAIASIGTSSDPPAAVANKTSNVRLSRFEVIVVSGKVRLAGDAGSRTIRP